VRYIAGTHASLALTYTELNADELIVISHADGSATVEHTSKTVSNGLVANETAVSIVQVTFSESFIDNEQVQVDSIVQMKS